MIHAMYGPGTDLLAFGTAHVIAGAALIYLGVQGSLASTVLIPATFGLGSGLTVASGTAVIGGIHLVGVGIGFFVVGGLDNGWWGTGEEDRV